MAFNQQTFKTRTITAIVFAIVMLLGIFWNQWSFLVLFSIIHAGCWWEYLKLTEKIHNTTFHIYTKLGLIVIGFGILLWFCNPVFYHVNTYNLKENLSLPVSAAGFALLLIGVFQKNAIQLKGFMIALAGLIYISLSLGLMIDLGSEVYEQGWSLFRENNIVLPCIIIFSLWINDTMAYIVGSLIGKTPLTKISPKKTWEGTIGGIILTGLVAYLVFSFTPYFPPGSGAVVAIIVAIAGTFGDLFESKLKRMAAVKDSGSFMPGHGGFLDRFDSLLFAIPFAWVLLKACLMGPCG